MVEAKKRKEARERGTKLAVADSEVVKQRERIYETRARRRIVGTSEYSNVVKYIHIELAVDKLPQLTAYTRAKYK